MSAGRIRQGGVFVEIGADARQFFTALNKVQKEIGKVGQAMTSIGSRMTGIGAALGAPFVAASVAGTRFDDVLRNVQASTGATASDLDAVRKAAMTMSQAMGVGPTEAAAGFLELLKAGMSLEDVLGGAGKAATAFAKVGGMAVADAAVVMADAMNVFKVSGDTAANTLSAAADASSTSIQGIALAFSQVSAVAGLANQSIQDTAAALAVLANAGVKGSDAGTSLKTMLMRLMAPADDAAVALQQIGLSTQSFRNADGTMKPLVDIIGTLTTAMQGMDQAAKDDIFRRIFGQDAIRAAAVLTTAGVDGFQAMRDSMAGAATVGDKFTTMTGGLSGAAASLYASLERLAIVVADAIAPSLASLAQSVMPVINGFAQFLSQNQELVVQVAKGIAIFTGVGAAITGMGLALNLVAGAMGLVLNPIGGTIALVTAAVAAIGHFSGAFEGLASVASTTFGGIYDAIANSDMSGAMGILWAGLEVGWLRGVEAIMGSVDSWVATFQNTFTYLGTGIASIWESMWSGIIQVLNTDKAIVMGVIDNIVNGVMASFDAMVAAVRKSWNFVQSFIVRGYDLAKENQKVDNEMAARARQRELSRPGIRGRMQTAAEENAATARETQGRIDAMNRAADATARGRLDVNAQRAAERSAAAAAAEARLGDLSRQQSDRRAFRAQGDSVIGDLGTATTMDQVRELADEFHALAETGQLTETQMKAFSDAVDAAQERIETDGVASGGAAASATVDPRAIADAAAAAARSQSEVAGTFSAQAVGGMGFGQSLAQKQLDALNKIEHNTRNDDAGAVAA